MFNEAGGLHQLECVLSNVFFVCLLFLEQSVIVFVYLVFYKIVYNQLKSALHQIMLAYFIAVIFLVTLHRMLC